MLPESTRRGEFFRQFGSPHELATLAAGRNIAANRAAIVGFLHTLIQEGRYQHVYRPTESAIAQIVQELETIQCGQPPPREDDLKMTSELELASLILNGISALSSSISAYYAATGRPTMVEPETPRPGELQSRADAAKRLATVVDRKLLTVMSANIAGARSELVLVLDDDSKSDADKDKAVEYASRAICAELGRLRKLNRGVLPTKSLERVWLSHGCGKADD